MVKTHSTRIGLGAGKGIGYRNLVPMDKYVHQLAGKGVKTYAPVMLNASNKSYEIESTLKTLPMLESGTLTERELLLLKRRINEGKIDPSLVFELHDEYKLTPEQVQKGKDWLMNLWKTPFGKERKNSPFGYREQEILNDFDTIVLEDFHPVGPMGNYYQPLYRVESKNSGGFYYYVFGHQINIVG